MADLNGKTDFIHRNNPEALEITSLMTGFMKRELLIAMGEKMANGKPPQISLYYPSRMKWVVYNHEHLPQYDEDSEVVRIETKKKVSES